VSNPIQQQVPEGYKQTEVGIIPEDWQVHPLSSQLKESPRYGIGAAAVPLTGKLPVYLRITDISEDGYFKPSKKVGVDRIDADEYVLQKGDLVFARTGASVGKSYLYREDDGKLVYAGFLIKVSPDSTKLLSSFLFQYVKTKPYWNFVQVMSMRSGQPGINGAEYGQLQLPIPPIKEQTAIADALSDVDGLIGSLEKLITKKRAIKTAAMQQLLTGKKRLPPFDQTHTGYKQTELGEIPNDWEVAELADIGLFSKGSGVKKDESLSGLLPCVRYGEIYTKHDEYIKLFCSFISESVAKTATKLSMGDLLFAGSGETKEDIGKCVAFMDGFEAYAGGDIVILSPRRGDSLFLGYCLNSDYVTKQKASKGQGDAVVHISANALSSVQIKLPRASAEQQSIAEVLFDMDKEIEALEQRLNKTKQLKQGMMQELLTGRTRLVESGKGRVESEKEKGSCEWKGES